MTGPKDSESSVDNVICPRCNTTLPPHAKFCGVCGELIKKKKCQEEQACTETEDDEAQGQEFIETLSLSAISRARLKSAQSSRSLRNNIRIGLASDINSLIQDAVASTVEEMITLSLPVVDLETEKLATVSPSQTSERHIADLNTRKLAAHPPSQPLMQRVTKPVSIVDAAFQKIVSILEPSSGSISSNGTLIQRFRLLVHLLWHHVHSHSLLRNSIYIIGTGIATSVLGYVFWILATHMYSAYDVGLGAALISAMTLASTFANLGVGSALIQTLPRRKAGSEWSLTLNAGLAIVTVASLLSGTIALVALPLVSQQFAIVENHIGYAIIFLAGVLLITVSMVLDQVFIAERAAQNMLVRNAAVSALKIPLMVLPVVLLAGLGALAIFGSGVLAMAIVLVGGMLLLVPHLGRAYRFFAVRGIVGQVRSMLSSLTGNYFINLGGIAMGYLLPIVVAIRLSATDNAYYFTTTSVSSFILMGASAVATSLFAEGSHTVDNLPHKVRSSVLIIAMMLGPEILVTLLGGSYILSVFGSSYAQHGLLLLRIDAISSIPDAITSVYVSVLRVQRRLRFAALLNLSMTVLTVILSWILLPMMGIAGQGLAYLIAAGAGSLAAGIDFLYTRRHRHVISESAF